MTVKRIVLYFRVALRCYRNGHEVAAVCECEGVYIFYIASEQYLVEMGEAVERILADGGHSVAEYNSRDQIGVAAPGEVLSVVVGIHVAAALNSYLEEVGLQAPCEVVAAYAARLTIVIDNLDVLERRCNVNNIYLVPVALCAAIVYSIYPVRAAERTDFYLLYALSDNDGSELRAYREYIFESVYFVIELKMCQRCAAECLSSYIFNRVGEIELCHSASVECYLVYHSDCVGDCGYLERAAVPERGIRNFLDSI